ncbi:glycoside hydrolase family 3 N-terminal domain-containing protein [Actinotalea sp. AC32]|nr:glycoside hydrolase family 3 N-terminal domain-containing protein [Actinotalea sp. AC32]
MSRRSPGSGPATVLLSCTLVLAACSVPLGSTAAPAAVGAAGSAEHVGDRGPGPGAGTGSAADDDDACTPAPLADRAAAVLVVGLPHVTSPDDPLVAEVTRVGVGGVFLSEANVVDAAQVTELVAGLRERSPRPLVVSTDEESGRVSVTRAIVGPGPSPRRLAAQRTPDEVRDLAAGIGERLAAVGIDLDLAPSLDLDDGPWDGTIGDRSFGGDPEVASQYGLAFAAGLDDAGVVPTVKHFPGHGSSSTDTHRTSDVVAAPLADLQGHDLEPFQDAVDAGAPVVMLNHLAYEALNPDLPASLSPGAYALLRDMGFEGVAITDSIGMGAVNTRWDFPTATVLAVQAGADAVLATDGTQAGAMRDALVAAVRSGELAEERLDVAAARTTALAGGDPVAMSCLDVHLPRLDVDRGDQPPSEASGRADG